MFRCGLLRMNFSLAIGFSSTPVVSVVVSAAASDPLFQTASSPRPGLNG
jgi:hypothetical protein